MTSVTIGSDVPYAIFHNEGASGSSTIGAHTSRGKGITTSIRGSSGFVGGRFTRGRARKVTFLGAEHQVSAHTRKANLPKRQFIGDSKQLERKIVTELETKIRKVFSELRR
jgi:phage gpG-like protein